MTQADEVRNRREELKRQYGTAFKRASEILFEEDIVGINLGKHGRIRTRGWHHLTQIHGCQSADDVRQVIHGEFVKWFDAGIAGSPKMYQSIAKRFWDEIIPLIKRNDE